MTGVTYVTGLRYIKLLNKSFEMKHKKTKTWDGKI